MYRFTSSTKPRPGNSRAPKHQGTGSPSDVLDDGEIHALAADPDGAVTWVGPLDGSASEAPVRQQAQAMGATVFDGGEGCYFAPHAKGKGGVVYFTTKGDDRVWAHHTRGQTLELIYPGPLVDPGTRVLDGVDNIIVSSHTGNVYVAEDGGNMEVVVIEGVGGSDPRAAALVRATGPQHGFTNPSEVPTESEITGLAISPDGSRLYFNSQRAYVLGITYELQAPPGTHF